MIDQPNQHQRFERRRRMIFLSRISGPLLIWYYLQIRKELSKGLAKILSMNELNCVTDLITSVNTRSATSSLYTFYYSNYPVSQSLPYMHDSQTWLRVETLVQSWDTVWKAWGLRKQFKLERRNRRCAEQMRRDRQCAEQMRHRTDKT